MSRATQDTDRLRQRFAYGIITLYDATFQMLPLHWFLATTQSYNPDTAETASVWASPVSLATTPGITICFLLLWVLRCFSSPRLPSAYNGMIRYYHIGLPHSEICGSIRICQSPQLIAAYHVLLRLPEPRHPPCALIHFLFADRMMIIYPIN